MDEFKSIVGGVWNVFVDFFDGGVVDTADNIDEWLEVDGLRITCFGVACDKLVKVDQIDGCDVDDEIKMAWFPGPQCGNPLFPPIGNGYVDGEVKTAGFPRPRCDKTGFLRVNDAIGWPIDYHLEFGVD
jgi:hypothetical protein